MIRYLAALGAALLLAACSSAGTATAALPAAAAQTPDDGPLRAAVGRLAAAWNAGDAQRWAAEYWPDGSLVNILGAVFPSAEGVQTVTGSDTRWAVQGQHVRPGRAPHPLRRSRRGDR